MEPLYVILFAALALIVVAVLVTRALVKSRQAAFYQSIIAKLEAEVAHQKEAVENARKDKDALIEAREKAHQETLAAREQAHQEAMAALKENFATAMGQLKAQVKEDTDTLLKERQKEFKETSGEAIGTLLNPLKEKLEDLRKEMTANSDVHKSSREAIKSDVDTLMKYTNRVATSTDQLAAAFKYGNKLQGIWGETILEELLSSQGLTKGIHFDVQPTLADSSVLRPDVIIHLDRRREVIVDAKTSLSAYIDYVNADNEEDRAKFLKAHLESIRTHVKELARKDYSAYIQPPKVSAGYVIMFVPNMGALWTALNAEPDLWRRAAEQNVYIADEQSLYGAIRIVQLTWTQVQQAENHEKVYALADEMIDRVEKFLVNYESVGKALENALKAYDDGHRKLEPGGQSILKTAGKLVTLGAKKGRHIEKALLDIDEIPAEPQLPASPEEQQ